MDQERKDDAWWVESTLSLVAIGIPVTFLGLKMSIEEAQRVQVDGGSVILVLLPFLIYAGIEMAIFGTAAYCGYRSLNEN